MKTDGNKGCSKNSCGCSSEKAPVSSSRRNFMKLGLTAGALAAFNSVSLVAMAESRQKIDDDTIKVLTPEGNLVEVPKSAVQDCKISKKERLEMRKGVPGRKWVMVIDLSRCNSALKCQEACSKHHNLSGGRQWLEVLAMKDSEDTAPYWLPKLCYHCDRPPCVAVCPVGATFKRSDGLVLIDNERCIGCRFCMAACPYSARTFNWNSNDSGGIENNCHASPEKSVHQKTGTVDKCDFCIDSVKEGELQPCITACPNGVYFFGDMNEDTVTNGSETYRFSELIRDKAGYRYLEELGVQPSVYYLPPTNRQDEFNIQDRLDYIEKKRIENESPN